MHINDLLSQIHFHEVPKRAIFSIPSQLVDGFVISIKGLLDFNILAAATGLHVLVANSHNALLSCYPLHFTMGCIDSEAQPLNQDLEVLAKNQGTLSLTSNLKTRSIKWLLEISMDPEVKGPLDLAYPGHSNFFGWETQDDNVLSGTLDSGIANHMVIATTLNFCYPEGVSFLIPDTDSVPALGQKIRYSSDIQTAILSIPSINQIIANCTFLTCVMVGVQFDKKDIIRIDKRSGSGFRGTEVPGSKHNDAFILKDGKLEEVLKSDERITIVTEFLF
ncbi:hypothetical protein F4604DRAFT_1684751 [Suillus subluteus]|nr:hypothetical protein F4604DRAFT_1684751 [Suillus subluteus]